MDKNTPVEQWIKETGVYFYSNPLVPDEGIDLLFKPICKKINASGYCYTAESCQGHPDATEPTNGWNDSPKVFLRLGFHMEDTGRVMTALLGSSKFTDHLGCDGAVSFELYPRETKEGWMDLTVVIKSGNVWQRARALDFWNRFANDLETMK